MKLRLQARVSSNSPDAVGRILVATFGTASVTRDGTDWIVRAEVDGASARDANRELLSELRRVERKTRLRAEWTAGGSVELATDRSVTCDGNPISGAAHNSGLCFTGGPLPRFMRPASLIEHPPSLSCSSVLRR